MKNAIKLFVLVIGSWYGVEAFQGRPVHVKGPELMDAVESSDPKLLKSLLFHRQELPQKELTYLRKRAKEIANERRRSISLYRSPWDLGRFVIGGCLAAAYTLGIPILGGYNANAEYERIRKVLQDNPSVEERRKELETRANIDRKLEARKKVIEDAKKYPSRGKLEEQKEREIADRLQEKIDQEKTKIARQKSQNEHLFKRDGHLEPVISLQDRLAEAQVRREEDVNNLLRQYRRWDPLTDTYKLPKLREIIPLLSEWEQRLVISRLSLEERAIIRDQQIILPDKNDPSSRAGLLFSGASRDKADEKMNPAVRLYNADQYEKWRNGYVGKQFELGLGGLVDTLLGVFGFYWIARGYYCVTAQERYNYAQRVVEILEAIPVAEERLS